MGVGGRRVVESPAVFLDPGKLLVILIVALVVLGPDKLPGVARQLGAAWGEIRKFRQRLETEVRGTFPDLPSTHQVAQAVRSPLAFLDQLADAHEREQQQTAGQPAEEQPSRVQPSEDRQDLESAVDRPLSITPSVPVTTGESEQAGSSDRPVPATVDPEVRGPVPALTN